MCLIVRVIELASNDWRSALSRLERAWLQRSLTRRRALRTPPQKTFPSIFLLRQPMAWAAAVAAAAAAAAAAGMMKSENWTVAATVHALAHLRRPRGSSGRHRRETSCS